ncbi:DUF2270 domain-containing protein [Natrarchaeobaculum sulfurireducens]|uniref:DUF2270 domain-containing protein n=1 Tax=Natrarchaeobaculum sulfurireducens TaxID=2044521 RepID=A0A346PSG9_9EURY|nr:DUF2270 domain-containing protein [Natrarchaeobaculum sulfurireducens]AXR82464.1 hypothetical protein AArcMg_2472 [Natrarchaeobaculum sulfurireducens]
MTDSNSDEFDPTAPDQREIGREMVDDSTGLGSVMAHVYRGEIDRVGTWRERLDETTTWAVTLMAAILTWAFSSPDNPHYILLVGILIVTIFLGIEARRYRDYDVFRSRARIIQENLFANALDPSQGVESHDWRAELSRDYRRPTLKVSVYEALANRLQRVYLALLSVLLVAWVFRITAFAPRQDWLTTAEIARIPGIAVVAVVGVFYVVLLGVTFWPHERHAKGEFREGDPDDWKENR